RHSVGIVQPGLNQAHGSRLTGERLRVRQRNPPGFVVGGAALERGAYSRAITPSAVSEAHLEGVAGPRSEAARQAHAQQGAVRGAGQLPRRMEPSYRLEVGTH